jgi:flavin reductase (DIM6/NTAB) family NADH-FMN oxidoreductase RutF
MKRIPPDSLLLKPFDLLDKEWALLVAGRERPNPMTVSWGGFGTLWNRPMLTVYVRPVRHTFSLLDAEPVFTLNFLPEALRPAMQLCGERSGRDTDKWTATGLHTAPSATIPVPRVAEAHLALECRVVATLDIDPRRFLDRSVQDLYPEKDYHRVFFGEVEAVWSKEG